MQHHSHSPLLVVASILIAAFASYTSLDLASSVSIARGRIRAAWLLGGSLAMGVGIWSMHFIGMLAFRMHGVQIAYDIKLLILSIMVAIAASALALWIISRPQVSTAAYALGSLFMGGAIAGMHYIGIASIRMGARWEWNWWLVATSIAIAISASFAAMQAAFRLRSDLSPRGFLYRGAGGVVMGFAIAGMHYTGMAAMRFFPAAPILVRDEEMLATSGLAVAVIGSTLLILIIALLGSLVDRSLARRQAVAELIRENEARLRLITNSVPSFIGAVGWDLKFTFVNRVYNEWFGEHVGAGTPVQELVSRETFERLEPAMRKALAGEEVAISTELLHRTLGPRMVEARYIPDVDFRGQVRGFFVSGHDVTEKNRQEEALREAVRARDEFLSIASHELKTPLTSLNLQAQLRSRNLEKKNLEAFLPEKLSKMVQGDLRQLARLSRLIDDMLDISRINTGKLTIQRETFDLCPLVHDVLERYRHQFESANCQVSFTCESSAEGFWDKFRLEQVIANLFTNAMRYGTGKPVHVKLKKVSGTALLEVSDRGIGIAKENQERIFQRFERAVAPNEYSGLGLGLYIVRQIVEMHGGKIWVESELGQGSCFKVQLPLTLESGRASS